MTQVQISRSSVPGARPTVGSQPTGSLYVNFADQKLGYIDPAGAPIDLPTGGGPVTFPVTSVNTKVGDVVLTATDVGAADATHTHDFPVDSVNAKTGDVVLTAADVGAADASHNHDGVYAPAVHNHDADYVNVTGDTMTGPLLLPVDGLKVGTDQIVTSGDNVGFGITSPRAKIEINSRGTWSGNNYGKGLYVTSTGLANPAIGLSDANGANNVALVNTNGRFGICHMPAITDETTAPIERIVLATNGNVGIGVDGIAPPFSLTVGHSISDGAWVTGSGYVSNFGIGGYVNSGDGSFQIKYDRSNGLTTLQTGPKDALADALAIGTNGFIGFSRSLPAARIDLNGSAVHNVVNTTGAMDVLLGNLFACTVSGPTAFTFYNTPPARAMTVVLGVANGGSAVVNWPASLRFPGGVAPTLTAVGVDILTFITYDGGTSWRGTVFGKDI